jgi:hypothetical protein
LTGKGALISLKHHCRKIEVSRRGVNPRINGDRSHRTQRGRVGNDDIAVAVAVKLKRLPDFTCRKSSLSSLKAVVVVAGDVVGITVARKPRDHVWRRRRAWQRPTGRLGDVVIGPLRARGQNPGKQTGAKKQGEKCPQRSCERWVLIHFHKKSPLG